jgi:hypothetical protein
MEDSAPVLKDRDNETVVADIARNQIKVRKPRKISPG